VKWQTSQLRPLSILKREAKWGILCRTCYINNQQTKMGKGVRWNRISRGIRFMMKLKYMNVMVSYYQRFLCYLAFKYFGFECTWWMLFQKRIVRTKFDIYVFIYNNKKSYKYFWKYDCARCMLIWYLSVRTM
jgi:hypothetical protein